MFMKKAIYFWLVLQSVSCINEQCGACPQDYEKSVLARKESYNYTNSISMKGGDVITGKGNLYFIFNFA